jgi:GDPmannose 4,6-dehydratase
MVVGMQGSKKTALITGATGQDGFYLAQQLVSNGYKVVGTSRTYNGWMPIGMGQKIQILANAYTIETLRQTISDIAPDFIFNLAGQSYVSRSWDLINETLDSQGLLISRILQALEQSPRDIKLLNMTSAEIFDHSLDTQFDENSPTKPYNPYGCAQLLGYNLINVYRDIKNVWAANAILFPHESIRRPEGFLFQKILKAAKNISEGNEQQLTIGNLKTIRDWGYAPIYMEGVLAQSQLQNPTDFCFCTGQAYSVEQILERAFSNYGLDYNNHILIDNKLVRNYEPQLSFGNCKKAKQLLNWNYSLDGLTVVDKIGELMCSGE